jgi:hypothetical protein
LVALEIGRDRVTMNVHLPLNELELALGHDSLNTLNKRSPHGKLLSECTSLGMFVPSRAQQTRSGPFLVTVHAFLIPPTATDLRYFVLYYDVLIHQVMTHNALVPVQSDWAGGRVEPVQLGSIAVDNATTRIKPWAIHLGEGSWRAGFQAMLSLGMHHIRQGTDHLLFCLFSCCLRPCG